ncbi:hypothetical protein MUK42_32887 [Musa troglodytarum]|nr:hypothetical protein MUK42_32887 [Musa troglodytarum]
MALAIACTTIAQNSAQDFVDAHNSARAAVGVGPVSWDDNVAAYAQNYANQRIGDCQLVHSRGSYGENLFGAPAPTSRRLTPSIAGSARSSTTTTTATRALTARSATTTRRWCGGTRRPSAVLGCGATAAPSSSSATTTQRATSWGSALTETTLSSSL